MTSTNSGYGLDYWGLMPQQRPGSYRGGDDDDDDDDEMSVLLVEETKPPTYSKLLTIVHTHGLCPLSVPNPCCSVVKPGEAIQGAMRTTP